MDNTLEGLRMLAGFGFVVAKIIAVAVVWDWLKRKMRKEVDGGRGGGVNREAW